MGDLLIKTLTTAVDALIKQNKSQIALLEGIKTGLAGHKNEIMTGAPPSLRVQRVYGRSILKDAEHIPGIREKDDTLSTPWGRSILKEMRRVADSDYDWYGLDMVEERLKEWNGPYDDPCSPKPSDPTPDCDEALTAEEKSRAKAVTEFLKATSFNLDPFPACFHCAGGCIGKGCFYHEDCSESRCSSCNFLDICRSKSVGSPVSNTL